MKNTQEGMVAPNHKSATGPAATNSDEKTPLLTSKSVTAKNGDRATSASSSSSSATSRLSFVAIIGAVVLVVLGVGTAAYRYNQYRLRGEFAEAVKQRTIDFMARVPHTCQSCSVVLPSNTYAGRGLGSAIDASDCVVRFNAHVPAAAPAEDYGAKDDVRIINGNAETGWAVNGDPCFNGGCRRTFMTWWNEGDDRESQKFLVGHPGTEYLGSVWEQLDMKDPTEVIHNYATDVAFGTEFAEASTAFKAITTLINPTLCDNGAVTIFGLDSADSDEAQAQYLDNGHHGPNCGGAECNSHSFILEHTYYKQAIAEKWPGWENAKWIPMDSVPVKETPTEVEQVPQDQPEQPEQPEQQEQPVQPVQRVQQSRKSSKHVGADGGHHHVLSSKRHVGHRD